MLLGFALLHLDASRPSRTCLACGADGAATSEAALASWLVWSSLRDMTHTLLRPVPRDASCPTLRFALITALLGSAMLGCAAASQVAPQAATAASEAASQAGPSIDAAAQRTNAAAYAVLVDSPDRSEDDRKLDDGRHPAELLAFIGVAPGARVADLAAGGGYTTELLARAVGPSGRVYGQNSKWALERFAEKPFSARLQKPVMANVTRLDRELEAPFPDDVRELDAVVDVLFYHDTFWLGVDRDQMNRAIFAALKPGGVYVVVDHSGREGTADTEVKTLHRVEEKLVREEILRAGFTLLEEGAFLKNPQDTRDWNASPREAGELRGTSDRFALKFVKNP